MITKEEVLAVRDLLRSRTSLYGNRQSTKPRPKYFFALEIGAGIVHVIKGEELARELEGTWRRNKSRTFVRTGFGVTVMPILVPLDEWQIMLGNEYERVNSHGMGLYLEPVKKLYDKVLYRLAKNGDEELESTLNQPVVGKREMARREQFQVLSSPLALDRLLELTGVELDDHGKQQFRQAWEQTLLQLTKEEN